MFDIEEALVPLPFVPPTCTILYYLWGFLNSSDNFLMLSNPGLIAEDPIL